MSAPLIDIGINLTHDSYDRDRAAVIGRAAAVGVVHLVITGASVEGSVAAATLAETDPLRFSATAGVHPHHATSLTREQLPVLEALLTRPVVRAVGECGLDYFRDYSPRDVQREAFDWQLDLACTHRRPLFLHQREAHADFLAQLKARGRDLPPAVAHCFTGTRDEAEAYLDLGLHIGITGWICDERRGAHLVEVVRHLPPERLMIETDGPYLLPRTLTPRPADRRNEPCFLPEVCRVVAEARGESPETLARTTTAVAQAFFGIGS